MRSSCIIWVGPKFSDSCPHKSEAEGDYAETEEEEAV